MAQLQEEENAEMTNTPEWYACDDAQMLTIPTMAKGETAFIVTGDASRNKIQTMPGGGMSTVAVELPADWDALMEEKGYEPLRSFYLDHPRDRIRHGVVICRPENVVDRSR